MEVLIAGISLLFLGVCGTYVAWHKHRQYKLINEIATTAVENVDSDGVVELKGEIAEPVDGDGFTSPFGQEDGVVFAAFEADRVCRYNSRDRLVVGIQSVPFYLDDGTGRVEVALGDRAKGERGSFLDVTRYVAEDGVSFDNVVCEFEELPTVETGSEPPTHILEFFRGERDSSAQIDSFSGLVDLQNSRRDCRYNEQTLRPGDDIYLLGRAEANDECSRPLAPEDVTVTIPDETFLIVSDRPEEALTDQLSSRFIYFWGAIASFGAGLWLLFPGYF